ncbi:aminopeptidase N [Leptospira idonii]|uniref:Aminopeptidase N n=1 Tax=Leptospira idonii TaxID=1193500 RepID=A0A4R9LZ32_9LEPT|nr:aminopeptidase N [Leptospira idonii]TGN18735.1 aminopeptidase N [Leptospira idonii]
MSPSSSFSSSPVHLLEDYSSPNWVTPKAHIRFDLDVENTIVRSEYTVRWNGVQNVTTLPSLFLNGEGMEFLSLRVDGAICDPEEFELTPTGLLLREPPSKEFLLVVENKISPKRNTALEGLYLSGSMLCTQNEPEGFRKITYSIDRPDNMIAFTVSLVGEKELFPVLLSNGNPVATRDLGTKQEAVWEDPFPKPSYLFAVVAGDLKEVSDTYTTLSGRTIQLKIFVESGNQEKTEFAMYSLKEAMRWDEETFGLEYDLDLYMIVAVDDFNMGAMENKGLNLFNSKLVLADKKSATDETFESILGVVAHEYFHNWTGNRVTLRNWFNLTLKEGLTVFRDQWFTEDKTDPSVKRIKDVLFLIDHQFPEDAGPMSHPILPKSYVEMNNFYTVTVYEKGSEVIRMLSVLLGRDGFKKGLKYYLSTYDGQGVTFEEFVSSMEKANGKELPLFRNWYHRKGTPLIQVREEWKPETGEFRLHFSDSEDSELGLMFPIPVALFDAEGKTLQDETLTMQGKSLSHTWKGFVSKPTASVFRNFSAPVKVSFERNEKEAAFLARTETDGFSRFFAFQEVIREKFGISLGSSKKIDKQVIFDIFSHTLQKKDSFPKDYLSYYLSFPGLTNLAESLQTFDYEEIYAQRVLWLREIADHFLPEFQELYEANRNHNPNQNREEIGKRKLKNIALYYLFHSSLDSNRLGNLALSQQKNAKHMSEELAVLRLFSEMGHPLQEESYLTYFEKWKNDSLVLDYWFSVQVSFRDNALLKAKELLEHSKFNWSNPNKVRSLIGAFARNPLSFHKADGSGYQFLSESIIRLNAINPQMAAALAKLFQSAWLQSGKRPTFASEQLKKISEIPNLSRELGEVVSTIRKGWGEKV